MKPLNDLVILASRSRWLFLFSAIVTYGSLAVVFKGINRTMQDSVGFVVFDMQNKLTVPHVFEQLSAYTPETKQLYYAFSFVDFMFPFFAALFMAAAAAFALRHAFNEFYLRVRDSSLFALLFLPTALDWTENIFALTVISSYPDQRETAAALMIWAKQGKLVSIVIAQTAVLIALLASGWRWTAIRLTARR